MHRRILFFILLLLSATAVTFSLKAQSPHDWRFGVIEAYQAPFAARSLGVSWTRFTFNWAEVQPDGPDSWTPHVPESFVDAEPRFGREAIGLLIGIPAWARDENDLPQGLWLAHDDPQNLWANYVREAVARYDGRISHWIIWNEPDIESSEIAHTWDGTVDDFYQLQRIAYLAAKETNPEAVVHLAAFTYWADEQAGREQYMARLLDRILADPEAVAHNYYFDVATAHLYFQADQVYDLLLVFQGIMRERGLNKAIWLVETNAPPFDDPTWPVTGPTLAVTQEEQAAFVPQAMAAAMAAGAQRISVFKMQDTVADRAANPEPFGLMRLDATTRLAHRSYETAIDYMAGTTFAERERWDEVAQFRLEQADRTTTVLFSRLPDVQQVQVPATAVTAQVVTMWGEKETITAQDGFFTLDLQQARCTQPIGDYCMIGGTVYYLIQAKNGGLPPEDLPVPLDNPLPSPTPWPTATAPATSTATAVPTVTSLPTTTIQPSKTPTKLPTPTETAVAATAVSSPTPKPTSTAAIIQAENSLSLMPIGVGVVMLVLLVGAGLWWKNR